MVRKYTEYDDPTDEGKKILEKSSKGVEKKLETMLHIVDQLPTQEIRNVEKDGKVHEFITVQEAVTTLWNERNEKNKI